MVLRADAGRTQGTGHVMRLLTLAEALADRGHEVLLASAEIDIPWLATAIAAAGVRIVPTVRDDIDVAQLSGLDPDWVVVDSYLVPPDGVTALTEHVSVLLLADGDARGAEATLFLDQNLGAPPLRGIDPRQQLLGVTYALVRRAVRAAAPAHPERLRGRPPHVVVVLGGTDPEDRTIEVAAACATLVERASFTFVAPDRQHERLRVLGAPSAAWAVLGHTPDLPALLGGADVIVSAGGTSAWDVGTLAVPALLLAVVENQQASLAAALEEGVALGFDIVTRRPDTGELAAAVDLLITDGAVRRRLVAACREVFDGRGAERVVRELEDRARTRPPVAAP